MKTAVSMAAVGSANLGLLRELEDVAASRARKARLERQRATLLREYLRAARRADAKTNWSKSSADELLLCVQRVEVQSCAVAPTSNEPVYTIAMFRSDDVGTTVYKTYGDIMYVVSLVATGVCEPTSHRTCGWAGCAAGSCILAFRLRGSAPCSVAWRWRR